MTEEPKEPENLILVYLRRIDTTVSEIRRVQSEHGQRLTAIEVAVARMRGDQANDAEIAALLAARVDRIAEEIDRIKRRLDLRDE